jgi:hypothetical protein
VIRAWQLFWIASLIVSGAAFAVITLVVTVRGFGDLREMFRRLREQRDSGKPGIE